MSKDTESSEGAKGNSEVSRARVLEAANEIQAVAGAKGSRGGGSVPVHEGTRGRPFARNRAYLPVLDVGIVGAHLTKISFLKGGTRA